MEIFTLKSNKCTWFSLKLINNDQFRGTAINATIEVLYIINAVSAESHSIP